MTRPVVIVGAGGFGREAADTVEAAGLEIVGVLDDNPSEVKVQRLRDRDISFLGSVDHWIEQPTEAEFVIGIGNPRVRRMLAEKLEHAGLHPATVVHPSALIGTRAKIGEGTVICAGVCLSTNVVTGRHVHVNPSVTVGHDTVLDDYVSVNPSVTIGGEVRICSETLLGSASNILQGLSIGCGTTIGASSLVTKDVPEGVVVKGVPGRW